jgi:hypothetical protein
VIALQLDSVAVPRAGVRVLARLEWLARLCAPGAVSVDTRWKRSGRHGSALGAASNAVEGGERLGFGVAAHFVARSAVRERPGLRAGGNGGALLGCRVTFVGRERQRRSAAPAPVGMSHAVVCRRHVVADTVRREALGLGTVVLRAFLRALGGGRRGSPSERDGREQDDNELEHSTPSCAQGFVDLRRVFGCFSFWKTIVR